MGFVGLLAFRIGSTHSGRSMPDASSFHRLGCFPQQNCRYRSWNSSCRGIWKKKKIVSPLISRFNFYVVHRLALKLIRVKKVKSGSCVESAMESGFLSDWILLFDSSMLMISVTFRTLMLNLTSPKCSVLYLIEFDSNWNFCLLKILSKRNRKVRIFIRPHYVDDD